MFCHLKYRQWNVTLLPLLVLVGFHILTLVQGKVLQGQLITHETWHFLDRFCFLSEAGELQYEIEYDTGNGMVSLLLYPDLKWNQVYKNESVQTCQDKVNALRMADNQKVTLMTPNLLIRSSLDSGCEPFIGKQKLNNENNRSLVDSQSINKISPSSDFGINRDETITTTTIVCTSKRMFSSSRARWWYIAVSSCNSTKGMNIKYKFRMTNGNKGDQWYEHFSAEEFYILPILYGFCFIHFLCLLVPAVIFAVILKYRKLLSPLNTLLLVSIALHLAGISALCIEYRIYALDGIGFPLIKLLGCALESFGETVFIFLLLAVAMGYKITRQQFSNSTFKKLVTACGFLLILCAYFLISEKLKYDPGVSSYVYETPYGHGYLTLRLIEWIAFVSAITMTVKNYPKKSLFFVSFCAVYSLWFLTVPAVIVISNYAIDKLNREKVAILVQNLCMFFGHLICLILQYSMQHN